MKSKVDILKKDYREWRQILDQSIWGIDPETILPTAAPDVMKE